MATGFITRPARASESAPPGPDTASGSDVAVRRATQPSQDAPRSPSRSRASSSGANGVGYWLPDPGHDCQSSHHHQIEGFSSKPIQHVDSESGQPVFVPGRGSRGEREAPLHDGQHGSPATSSTRVRRSVAAADVNPPVVIVTGWLMPAGSVGELPVGGGTIIHAVARSVSLPLMTAAVILAWPAATPVAPRPMPPPQLWRSPGRGDAPPGATLGSPPSVLTIRSTHSAKDTVAEGGGSPWR